MTSKRRWLKFWPQDWQRDPALRSCSPAARGVWMDLLCIAHEGTPYGHVTINGKAMTIKQIASVTGLASEKDAARLIAELETAGVFSRTDTGTIYSRRMERDHAASLTGKENVEKRWEKVRIGKTDPKKLNGELTKTDPNGGGDTPRVQKQKQKQKESETPLGVEGGLGETISAKPRLKPRTPIGDDWQPNEAGKLLAKSKNLNRSEIAKFVSYHQSRGNLMADWNAAWRTWCHKAAEWNSNAGLNPDGPPHMIGGLH